MTRVLVFKPGLVGEAEKQALIAAGIVPIETSDPAGVRLLEVEGDQVAAGDLLYAALKGVNQSPTAQSTFAGALLSLVEKSRQKPPPPPPMPSRDTKGRFLKPLSSSITPPTA